MGRLGVRAVLLCSSESLAKVSAAVENLQWARVIEQNRWHGGWTGSSDQVLTRLDSDDTLHEDWFTVVDRAEPRADVVGSRNFLRLHRPKARIYRYRRRTPCPLAAFRGGRNPYAVDHDEIHRYYRMVDAGEPFLLQVAHGGNIASRFPKPFRRRASAGILERFGLEPLGASDPPTR